MLFVGHRLRHLCLEVFRLAALVSFVVVVSAAATFAALRGLDLHKCQTEAGQASGSFKTLRKAHCDHDKMSHCCGVFQKFLLQL